MIFFSSWASFLIPSDDIQGRMALLVTLFLVLVNIFNAITTNSPKADGLNALQVKCATGCPYSLSTCVELSKMFSSTAEHGGTGDRRVNSSKTPKSDTLIIGQFSN